jgi:hypothetical protein
MATAKPFSWTVRFTVAPIWIQDGYTICNERALQMLARSVGAGSADELQAVVLEAPSPLELARMQGYGPQHSHAAKVVRDIKAGHGDDLGAIRNALMKSRDLLSSVAFVTKEGDTSEILQDIERAIELLDPRLGAAVGIEV